ncbi:exodeoxyribonuclease III Xth [Emticicia oligotrophica DSM 17448]|uniref:Exodeoxyribonuclease III Xth n=1 Tax=Emticicia oligotrophica (strain DSM 17448 / CIP 109782 / MTCC 6937 / GPTSA100-15) TaxID=929562 RepID=A0ABN4ALY7_EMTOG|nr:exodeoxyribonuclease III [Emticicia oligotrophica]AFK03073.1 exodeoxyribonuclease III Xth [Emticicia oligotrophica DSM 17448]
MKIISYNVNGIRSAINKGLLNWLKISNPDILCLQEIKLSETELVSPFFEELDYHCFWYPAQKRGYSGVALLSKTKPKHIQYGNGNPLVDNEGRMLRADFEDFSILSMYFPSGSSGDERQTVKMHFLEDFLVYVNNLRQELSNLVICGDVNICHREIDIHNPKSNANSSGFLPEEREWVGKFLDTGFVDTFRHFNQEPHHYTWWSYRAGAKQKNLGWRIDYHFVTENLKEKLISAAIHPDQLMSDHCPIELVLQ